jgi:putative tryptophan/tyrosine transport system substrate-binding protein
MQFDHKRRDFITLIGGVAAAWPSMAWAQQPAKRRTTIGILSTAGNASSVLFEVFRQELGRLGHIEGQTVVTEFRSARSDPSKLPALAGELVRIPVDVIVTDGGAPAALAAMHATSVIPIVMATIGDAVAQGIVDNLARPGGNITGFTLQSIGLSTKRLELLKEVVPGLQRVGVLWNPANSARQYDATEEAARALGLKLESGEAQSRMEVPEALGNLIRRKVSALVVLPEALFWNERVAVVIHATAARLPGIYPEREYVDAGGLFAYGPRVVDNFRQAAGYVDRIIKGARPSDLPVQQPTKFELTINLNTSKAFELTIPPTLLAIADEVIE